ncbi:MAG: DUF3783 domain-containing protein [Smithella sp.]
MNKGTSELEVMAMPQAMLKAKVGDALLSMMADGELKSTEKQEADEKSTSADLCKYRIVIVHAQEREQVLQVMRSFKAVLPDPQNIIFAVITETALNWTFDEYIGHLGEEHEYMKTRKPQ